jgi:hypothetical protein
MTRIGTLAALPLHGVHQHGERGRGCRAVSTLARSGGAAIDLVVLPRVPARPIPRFARGARRRIYLRLGQVRSRIRSTTASRPSRNTDASGRYGEGERAPPGFTTAAMIFPA